MNPHAPVTQGTFGARLLELRTERRLTKEQLAACAGMATNHYAHLEWGCGEPSLYTLRKLAGALGISISQLTEGVR